MLLCVCGKCCRPRKHIDCTHAHTFTKTIIIGRTLQMQSVWLLSRYDDAVLVAVFEAITWAFNCVYIFISAWFQVWDGDTWPVTWRCMRIFDSTSSVCVCERISIIFGSDSSIFTLDTISDYILFNVWALLMHHARARTHTGNANNAQ